MPCQALLTHSPTLSSSLRQGMTTLISTAPWPRKPFLAEHCGQLNSARNSTDSDKFAPLKFTGTPPHDKYHSCRVAPYHVSGRVRWKSQAVRLRTAPDVRDALSAHEADGLQVMLYCPGPPRSSATYLGIPGSNQADCGRRGRAITRQDPYCTGSIHHELPDIRGTAARKYSRRALCVTASSGWLSGFPCWRSRRWHGAHYQ